MVLDIQLQQKRPGYVTTIEERVEVVVAVLSTKKCFVFVLLFLVYFVSNNCIKLVR